MTLDACVTRGNCQCVRTQNTVVLYIAINYACADPLRYLDRTIARMWMGPWGWLQRGVSLWLFIVLVTSDYVIQLIMNIGLL